MSQDGLVPISLDGVVAFFTCLAIVIGVVLWREHKRKVRRREEYLAQFNSTHLRMSRYKIDAQLGMITLDHRPFLCWAHFLSPSNKKSFSTASLPVFA